MERKPKRRRQDTIKITFVTHSKSFYLWRERNWFLIHHVKYSLDDTLSYHQIPWYKCIQVQSMKCTLMYSFHLESLAITIFCLPSLSNPPWASPNTVACSQCLGLDVKPELMGHHTHACLQGCLARSQHLGSRVLLKPTRTLGMHSKTGLGCYIESHGCWYVPEPITIIWIQSMFSTSLQGLTIIKTCLS
jgi:hypothetical protein